MLMYSILLWLKVQIVSLNEETSEFEARSTFDHPYPTTKIMWIPDSVRLRSHKRIQNIDMARGRFNKELGLVLT